MSNWLDRDKESVWHPFSALKGGYPMQFLERAEGVYLYTENGDRIIDGISSWWVNTLGHSNQGIAKALFEQASKLEHVIFAGFTHEPGIRLSEELLELLPSNQQKVFFSDNGSTAVEVALKMTIQYWRNLGQSSRKRFIALDGAYHGDTFGSMSVGARDTFTEHFHSLLFDVDFIPLPEKEREAEILQTFEALCQRGDIAGFIFEPLIQGAAGMRIYSGEVLNALMNIAAKYEVICIADEIFTGFYRTGKFLATNHLDHTPDLICLSKGLTAGTMAMSVTTASQKIVHTFDSEEISKTFFHGHSFTGNPLGCAVALESLSQLRSKRIQDNLHLIENMQSRFVQEQSSHPMVKSIKSLGTLLVVELKTVEQSSYFNNLREYIYGYFLKKGVLLRPLGNIIYFLPPYIITREEIEIVQSAIRDFLGDLKNNLD